MKGIVGRKLGMSRVICQETGRVQPVTLLLVPEIEVVQVKTLEKDGYESVVLGLGKRKTQKKNRDNYFQLMKEFEVSEGVQVEKGASLGLESFATGDAVKVQGVSKGRGFAGVIKRHGFSRGPETHGSHHHREPGSVGTCAKPARILKGKKMPGHYGVATTTISGLKIVEIDPEKRLIAVSGAVPGSKNSFVSIYK